MIEITADAAAVAVAEAAPQKQAPVVIIGSGYAGYNLAEALRQRSPDKDILLLTADDGANYSKPGLSNALARDKRAIDLISETVLEIEQRLNIRIHARCKVTHIDADQHLLHTDLGVQQYSKLILAQGAAPIRLPLQGSGAEDVLSINDLNDYRHFRDQLDGCQHVTIIGNGLIGCEFANDLSSRGYSVAVIGLTGWPMDRLLPKEIGQKLQTNLSAQNVDWYLDNTVENVAKQGEGYRLTLRDGQVIETGLVISAVGLKPRTDLAETAGVTCNRGIVVNGGLRTNVADIYALGDCAEIQGQLLPYIAPINFGVRALADCLLGRPTMAQYPLMPVMVKTPALPLTLLTPAPNQTGEWQVESTETGMRGLYVSSDGRVLGYALAGDLIGERQQWTDKVAAADALSVA
ncbi:NAD(P)/FAD-dependent oxidoreductase [Amphritea sp.]|uniref:NAD(P)/FAD-dependent oxidoreductase n=1 Tax=Amphritea sp. TaxID=1872502 RepID=UPI003A95A962